MAWEDDGPRTCADCGLPLVDPSPAGHPFRVCRACYDVYVDNAGR